MSQEIIPIERPGKTIERIELERLRAENERLRAERDELFKANGDLAFFAAENERLRAEVNVVRLIYERLRAENERLQVALIEMRDNGSLPKEWIWFIDNALKSE